jgi:hypothetical protein
MPLFNLFQGIKTACEGRHGILPLVLERDDLVSDVREKTLDTGNAALIQRASERERARAAHRTAAAQQKRARSSNCRAEGT